MTPAQRLLAAAELLDKRASEATEGPWRANTWETVSGELRAEVEGDPREGNYRTRDRKGWTEVCRGDADCAGPGPYLMQADARYIATVHPGLGVALASWLRYEAERLAALTFQHTYISVEGDIIKEPCLTVADLVLAGE